MAGPGDEITAGEAGRGHLRASHADRENVIGTLQAAFVQGMLTKDELDLRVGQMLAARTYADLAALTADIPAGLTGSRPPQRARRPANKKTAAAVACATVASIGMFAGLPDDSGRIAVCDPGRPDRIGLVRDRADGLACAVRDVGEQPRGQEVRARTAAGRRRYRIPAAGTRRPRQADPPGP